METQIRLHWLRARGADLGTPIRLNQLEECVRQRVTEQIGRRAGVFDVKLPFLDQREMRRKAEMMEELEFERHDHWIVPAMPQTMEIRTHAADLALRHPAWIRAGQEKQPTYFRTWRKVSVALQRSLRAWIPRIYFADFRAFEDRETAFRVLLYQSSRPFHGIPCNDFTLDLRDYPESTATLEQAWKLTGGALRRTLEQVEQRLDLAGFPLLARRYSPKWYEDIVREVRRDPKVYVNLISKEAEFINSLIDLGAARSTSGVSSFSRSVNLRLRSVCGHDLRHLALNALDVATEVLVARASASFSL